MKRRFTILTAALALLTFLAVPLGMWGQSIEINTENFTKPNSGSGYAAYDGTRTIDGVDITSSNVMVQAGNLQFKKSAGYLYNSTAMPGNITKITLATATNFTIYVSTTANTETQSVTSGVAISGNYTYFKVKCGSSTGTTASITIEYSTGGSTTYTVTYDCNGGTSGCPENVTGIEPDDEITLADAPSKTGHAFDGWNDGTTTYDAGDSYTVSENVTMTAQWTAYTITALSNNDSWGTVSLSGFTITASPASGYQYATPAYTVSSGSATVVQSGNNFTVTPSSNCTVTINFEAIPTHAAIFSVNGTSTSLQVAEGAAITFPADPDDINGKTFVGWTTAAITGVSPTAPEFVTSATMGTNDVTFYAVFATEETSQGTVEHELTITPSTLTNLTSSYGDHTNTISVEDSDYTIDYNACKQSEKIQLRDNATISYIHFPTLPGNIKRVYSNDCYNGSGSTYSGTIHLKTSKKRGNSDTDDITKETFESVSTFSITMPGNNTAFYFLTSAGLRFGDLTVVYEVSGETIVYSGYCTTVPSESTWFVTYNGNGSDGGEVPTDNNEYNASNNTVTVLGPGTLTKTGHEFAYWTTDIEGEEGPYEEGNSYTISTNTVFYAQWFVNSYSYTLNVTGDDDDAIAVLMVDGSSVAEGASIAYGKEVTVDVATSDGYVYSISVKDASNNDVPVANDKFTMPASNVTVTVTTAEVPTYTLVTSTNQLVSGKHYIIVSSNSAGGAYAMGAQSGNFRAIVAVTITNASGAMSIEAVDGIRELVLSGNGNNWTLYDKVHPGFLYASSSSNNNIGTRSANEDEESQWAISFNDNQEAVIVAQGDNERNTIRYNVENSRFSCYRESGSSIENYVYLYVLANDKNYEFYSNTTLASATIANDETYTVHKPAVLNSAALTNNGTAANLIIEDGGQLITDNVVEGTIKKHITPYDPTLVGQGVSNGWYFISSPLNCDYEGINPTDITNMTTGDYDLYLFDPNVELEWVNFKGDNGNFGLINGHGYLYANSNDVTLEFAGSLNYFNEDFSSLENGWNLVGNPYAYNAYPSMSYYKMNDAGTAIESTESTGAIAPCTGILVNNEDGTTTDITFSRTAPNAKGGINLALAEAMRGATQMDNAIVSFNEGSKLGKFYFGTQNANLYIPQGTEEYAIVNAEAQGEMPINFRANEDGQYTLTVNPKNVDMNYLHLIDNMTGMDVDLLQTPSYTFNATTRDYESRFRLVFAANNEDGASTGSTTFAFYSNGSWIINNVGDATLQVIDATGRVLSSETVSGSVSKTINAVPGVYMLRLINGENVNVQKIVVR